VKEFWTFVETTLPTISCKMSDDSTSPYVLHDCLALGQIEDGLPASFESSPAEIHRLPVLLRWLSATADLKEDDPVLEGEDESTDEIIEEAVARLEDRAAFYSVAEEVEMISCHLAPSVTRRVSMIPSLKRQWKNGKYCFNVSELETLVQDPVGNLRNKRRRSTAAFTSEMNDNAAKCNDPTDDDDDDEVLRADDYVDDNDEFISESNQAPEKQIFRKRVRSDGGDDRFASTALSEDSPEFMATKTLQELISLTAISLKPETPFAIRGVEDSTLAVETEAAGAHKGAAINADLAALLVSLMHYTPVLRHDHVASALCRATVPQAPAIIARMGSNCPAVIPCLVRGCIQVYREATLSQNNCSIANMASKALRRLAGLSKRESSRILTMLQLENSCLMVDVQLEIAMQLDDPLTVACLLLEHLPHIQTAHDTLFDEDDRRQTTYNADNITSPSILHTSLQKILENSTEMLARTIKFLLRHLNDEPCGSQMCFILSALCMIFFRVSMEHLFNTGEGKACLLHGLDILCNRFNEFGSNQLVKEHDDNRVLSDRHERDRVFCCLSSTFILNLLFLSETDTQQKDTKVRSAEFLKRWFCTKVSSRFMEALQLRIFLAIKHRRPATLCNLLQEYVFDEKVFTAYPRKTFDCVAISFFVSRFCDWASNVAYLEKWEINKHFKDCAIVDPSVAIEYMQIESIAKIESEQLIRELLLHILSNKTVAYKFMLNSAACAAITNVTARLMESGPKVPLVTSVHIGLFANSLDEQNVGSFSQDMALWLVQIIHSMTFFGIEPNSPFSVDPRSLSLQKVYSRCQDNLKNGLPQSTKECVRALIEKISPGVARQFRRNVNLDLVTPRSSWPELSTEKKLKSLLCVTLRKSIANPLDDPSGMIAARTFSKASFHLDETDLFTLSASALLSHPHSSPLFFTFSMLYKDPLLLLKCPLSVWSRRGLRRILVFLLSCVLEKNDFVLWQSGLPLDQETIGELIDSRNEIVVRSLVSIASSNLKVDDSFGQCSATTGIIRKLVSRYPGLTAGLLKQGLDEKQTDWLIESVPESIGDVEDYERLLTGSNYLTAAEKLVLADSILRISIMHGHLIGSKAQSLVCATMSQMIASFFLIIGPSGVAVNSLLVGEGEGIDASQVSRKATFRMLLALQKVRGYRTHLRNECALSLQKFAGMIKGEVVVGTLPSAIANRQKALLTDLLDAVTKALDAMGSGIVL
jgi:hypothetical protein